MRQSGMQERQRLDQETASADGRVAASTDRTASATRGSRHPIARSDPRAHGAGDALQPSASSVTYEPIRVMSSARSSREPAEAEAGLAALAGLLLDAATRMLDETGPEEVRG